MSDENSVFLCNCCDEKLSGKLVAYRHIKEGYGLRIEGSQDLVKFMERKFLREIMVI